MLLLREVPMVMEEMATKTRMMRTRQMRILLNAENVGEEAHSLLLNEVL